MLSQFLVNELFVFALIFCRIGSALMIMPGFGEIFVSPRVRLVMAIAISIALAPVVQSMPVMPSSGAQLVILMTAEIMVGLFIGAITRLLIATIHIAGMIISYQSSMAMAITNGINQFQGQDTSIGNFLSISVVVLIFVTNLHHLLLRGLADSYTLFYPGTFPPINDFAMHATQTMRDIFAMAAQIASPNIAIGVMLYLGAGILARLMPNVQIFFVMMPAQLTLSFFIIMTSVSTIMLWYLDFFERSLIGFLSPG